MVGLDPVFFKARRNRPEAYHARQGHIVVRVGSAAWAPQKPFKDRTQTELQLDGLRPAAGIAAKEMETETPALGEGELSAALEAFRGYLRAHGSPPVAFLGSAPTMSATPIGVLNVRFPSNRLARFAGFVTLPQNYHPGLAAILERTERPSEKGERHG